MKLIRPTTLTESNLIATNATESVPLWLVGTSYDMGDQVYLGVSIYESLTNANVGNDPSTDTVNWLRIGPTNAWAMFDNEVNTQTIVAGGLSVEVAPGALFDSLALFNLSGSAVNVVVTNGDGGPEVYNQTFSLDASVESVIDWFTYFFEPFDLRTDLVLTNISPYSAGRLFVDVVSSGDAACGAFIVGTFTSIGTTLMGAGVGIRDYSTKETDEFGVTTFVQRNFSKRMNANVFVTNTRLNSVFRTLSQLRAVPTVAIGTDADGYEVLSQYGFLKDWNIEIAYPEQSLISIEFEGLI